MAKNGSVASECRTGKRPISRSSGLQPVDREAERLAGDPRLGFMAAGRTASNVKRAPLFRSSRVA